MSAVSYRCKNDPNHDRFRANVIEHVEWYIDRDGNYVEQGECSDSKIIEVRECAICGGEVEEVDDLNR